MKHTENHRSGYVAIIGKPNAGKSTLMNRLLGNKVSITTHKPQTTRHQIIHDVVIVSYRMKNLGDFACFFAFSDGLKAKMRIGVLGTRVLRTLFFHNGIIVTQISRYRNENPAR